MERVYEIFWAVVFYLIVFGSREPHTVGYRKCLLKRIREVERV